MDKLCAASCHVSLSLTTFFIDDINTNDSIEYKFKIGIPIEMFL